MSKIRANFISSKNDNKAVEFTSGIVVGGAVTATNFDFNADTYNGEVYNVGTGASIYQESSNQLKFGIGNQEAVSIRGDESVDIGGTPPWTTTGSGYRNLSISGSTQSSSAFVWLGNGAATQNNGFDLARINIMNGPTIVSQIKGSTGDGNNDSGKITFITKATGSSLAEAATFTTAGNLAFPSGQGIDFSATADGSGTNTSELLDDYETGNWTPVLKSSSNVITVTGSQNYYRYIKIGRMVTLFYCINNATTSGTTGGTCTIGGLPFAPSASTQNNRFMSGDVMFYNTGFKLDAWPIYPHSASGDLTINFYEKASAGAQYNSANVNTVGAGSYFFFTFTYYTD